MYNQSLIALGLMDKGEHIWQIMGSLQMLCYTFLVIFKL